MSITLVHEIEFAITSVHHTGLPHAVSLAVNVCSNHTIGARRINALYPHEWFNGVYLWLWRMDPDAGGSSDDSYTPQNKPAAEVMKSLFLAQ